MNNATPTPWTVEGRENYSLNEGHYISGMTIEGDGNIIAELAEWQSVTEAISNAELICRAVNSYEAMKEALAEAQAFIGDIVREGNDDQEAQIVYNSVKAALALAEGKE